MTYIDVETQRAWLQAPPAERVRIQRETQQLATEASRRLSAVTWRRRLLTPLLAIAIWAAVIVLGMSGFVIVTNPRDGISFGEFVVGASVFGGVLVLLGTHDRLNGFLNRAAGDWEREEQKWRNLRDMHNATVGFMRTYK